MVPIWVIRASRTAFTLRLNRGSTFNHGHTGPPSTVIFHPLFYLLLSTLVPSIRNPQPAPSRHFISTSPNYSSYSNSQLAAYKSQPTLLQCPDPSHKSSLSDSFDPSTNWPLRLLHILKSTSSHISRLLPPTQRNAIGTSPRACHLSHWVLVPTCTLASPEAHLRSKEECSSVAQQRLTLTTNQPISSSLFFGLTGALFFLQRTVHCMMSHAVVSALVTPHLTPSGEHVLQFAQLGHFMPKQALSLGRDISRT